MSEVWFVEKNGKRRKGIFKMIIRISFWAYIRTMWLILWTAFRHPFETTEIDILSGECRKAH